MFGSIIAHSVSRETKVRYFECPADIQQTVATLQHPVNLEWTFVYVVHALTFTSIYLVLQEVQRSQTYVAEMKMSSIDHM